MTDGRNSTDEQDVADLRRAFQMALADSLKGDKIPAATLEIVRKFLADQDANHRWAVEQAALLAGVAVPAKVPEATEVDPDPYTPPLPPGLNLPPLPFPVKRRGPEYPPASGATKAPAENTEKPADWTGLSQVPFLTPDH